jgi:hypothetical protein
MPAWGAMLRHHGLFRASMMGQSARKPHRWLGEM